MGNTACDSNWYTVNSNNGVSISYLGIGNLKREYFQFVLLFA